MKGRFFFSPDMGRFEHKGSRFYFQTGLVTEDNIIIRLMPSDHDIEYSKWSNKKREKMLKKCNKRSKKREKMLKKCNKRRR